jgi:hypothetical protein
MAEDTQGHLQEKEHPRSGVSRVLSVTQIQESDLSHVNLQKGVSDGSMPVLILTQELRSLTIPKT